LSTKRDAPIEAGGEEPGFSDSNSYIAGRTQTLFWRAGGSIGDSTMSGFSSGNHADGAG